MKFFNQGQAIFIIICMLVVMFITSNILAYHFGGLSIKEIIANWDTLKIAEIITEDYVPPHIKQLGYKAIFLSFLISLLLPSAALISLNLNKKPSLHGDAKFACVKDISASKSVTLGEQNSRGIIVGKFKGKLVRYIKPDFVSLGAGTRAGKGAGIVIPNLLEWQDSLLVLDIKQECFNITSKYRQQVLGQEVYLFNPFSFETHKFNPFYYLDLGSREGSTELMGVAEIIYPTSSTHGAEGHFNNMAQSIFMALAKTLWLVLKFNPMFIRKHNIKSIFSIGNLFTLYGAVPIPDLITILDENISTKNLEEIEMELAIDALTRMRSFKLLGDEGKANVIATFEKQLKLFSLPVVKNATDENDFDFRALRRKKMTIYLSIAPKDLKISSLILNLFFNCAIKINLSENPDFMPELKYSLLLILDEFPAIGSILYVKDAAGYIAGYKVQLLTIFQNVSQLNEIYGEQGRKTLLANHSCKVVFAPSEQDDAEYFSREIAYITTKSSSKSRNEHKTSITRGTSESEAKRALILPQELKQMPFEEEIVILGGENPIKCKKALYFNDRFFMDKLIALSPTLKACSSKRKLPSKEDLAVALGNGELAISFESST